jgi:hypothetical protein
VGLFAEKRYLTVVPEFSEAAIHDDRLGDRYFAFGINLHNPLAMYLAIEVDSECRSVRCRLRAIGFSRGAPMGRIKSKTESSKDQPEDESACSEAEISYAHS